MTTHPPTKRVTRVMQVMQVAFARLHPEALLPQRMSAEAAGLDLRACLGSGQRLELPPGGRALVPTGLQLVLPPAHEGQVRPRSGMALRHGVTVLNSPGTIDSDYRGELRVLLINHGAEAFVVQHGDRVAQLVIAPVVMAEPLEVEFVEAQGGRGEGGYGSTGGFGPRST